MKEILREDIRREALTAAEKTNAKYIGVRNLLGGSTLRAEIETDEAIATSSPYTLADEALGFMKKHGLSLFLRIDYREILEDETAMFQKLQEFCAMPYRYTVSRMWHNGKSSSMSLWKRSDTV